MARAYCRRGGRGDGGARPVRGMKKAVRAHSEAGTGPHQAQAVVMGGRRGLDLRRPAHGVRHKTSGQKNRARAGLHDEGHQQDGEPTARETIFRGVHRGGGELRGRELSREEGSYETVFTASFVAMEKA